MNAERSFVDTNILVYAFGKTASGKQTVAKRLLDDLMASDLLRVSTQVLQELFVTLTRKVKTCCTGKEALSVLEELTVWPVVSIDYSVIREAVGLAGDAQLSFWDALVVVAAARCGAGVLYTEDLNHGQEILGVRVCNPFT